MSKPFRGIFPWNGIFVFVEKNELFGKETLSSE